MGAGTIERRFGSLGRHWPLWVAVAVLWGVLALLLMVSMGQNQGRLAYAIDDPYIHMAMARSFASSGVWGVTPYEFSSSSSSLLWTLILSAVFFIVGPAEVVPLVLNVVFATALLLVAYAILYYHRLPAYYLFAVLLALTFFTPLPPLVFTGQEHLLHAAVTILFVYLAARELSREAGRTGSRRAIWLLVLAPLAPLTRYESLFLLAVVCLLFVLRRRWRYAAALGVLGILPIGLYGLISMAQGWYPLPNSVLLKGNLSRLVTGLLKGGVSGPAFWEGMLDLSGYSSYAQLVANPHVFSLVVVALFLIVLGFRHRAGFWTVGPVMTAVFTLSTVLHMQFARTGWFYRYEAYLVALGVVLIALAVGEYVPGRLAIQRLDRALVPQYLAVVLLAAVMAMPLAQRGGAALLATPQATTNIYQQQYQMGLFFRDFYAGEGVAANDIGAIGYLADVRLLDLWGLASREVAEARRGWYYDSAKMHELAVQKGARVAVVYDSLFDRYGGVPSWWVKVGQWKIQNNVVAGGDTVSFYAVDPGEAARLAKNLKAFSSRLPSSVVQSGTYLQ